jgi:hypothetical protein
MEASELRIGNWVYDIRGEQNIQCDLQFMKQAHDRIYPIPLTEDWLVRLGFRLIRECYYKGNFQFYPKLGLWFWFEIAIHPDRLKHVHQLQNLYFALTGEELQIID